MKFVVLLSFFFLCLLYGSCQEYQNTALSDFYTSLSGNGWYNSTGWLSGEDPCGNSTSWVGVICEGPYIASLFVNYLFLLYSTYSYLFFLFLEFFLIITYKALYLLHYPNFLILLICKWFCYHYIHLFNIICRNLSYNSIRGIIPTTYSTFQYLNTLLVYFMHQ